MKTIYLANGLGFDPFLHKALDGFKKVLETKYIVLEPFEQNKMIVDKYMPLINRTSNVYIRERLYREMSEEIGKMNEYLMARSDIMVALLSDLDEGVMSEIGWFSSRGKPVYGLYTSLLDRGDFPGLKVNLQVEHFINRSGGKMFTNERQLFKYLNI